MSVTYEWDIEQWQGEDCIDHYHSETLTGDHAALARVGGFERNSESTWQLVLVRENYIENATVLDRQWACVSDGKLPTYFKEGDNREGAKVPQRFHKQIKKVVDSAAKTA